MSSPPQNDRPDDELETADSFDVFKTYSKDPAASSYTADSASSNASSSTLTLNSTSTANSQPSFSSYDTSVDDVDSVPGKDKEREMMAALPSQAATPAPPLKLGPHQPKNQREIDRRSVYVSNIPFKISPWKLKVLFCQGTDKIKGCGKESVNRVTIVCDRVTGLPKGYAYVEFASEDNVPDAVKFNGLEVDGRVIGVSAKRTNVPGVHGSTSTAQDGRLPDHDALSRDIDRLHLSSDSSSTFSPDEEVAKTTDGNVVQSTSSSNAKSNFYNSDNAKNYKNHRNSNYNFIKNANQIFNHRHYAPRGTTASRHHSPKINHLLRNPPEPSQDDDNTSNNDGPRNNHPLSSSGSGTRGGFRGLQRYQGRGRHRTHSNSNNNNKNNNNNDKANSSTNAPVNSKLVIDKYHYLTPSSRVGVYNHANTNSNNVTTTTTTTTTTNTNTNNNDL